MANVSDVFNLMPIEVPKNSPTVVAYRHVGLECERETCAAKNESVYKPYKRIQFKADGSLRNNGKELVFNKALAGNQIIEAIKELDFIFNNFEMTHSERTSDHIHVNIQDFTDTDIEVLYHNLLALEATFFNVGKVKFSRVNNSYCMPHWEFLKIRPLEDTPWGIFSFPKYLSYRFCGGYGSVEFRMFESVNSASRLLSRINLCLEVVDRSKQGIMIDINKPLEEEFIKLCPRMGPQYLWAVVPSPNIHINCGKFNLDEFFDPKSNRLSMTQRYKNKKKREYLQEKVTPNEVKSPEELVNFVWNSFMIGEPGFINQTQTVNPDTTAAWVPHPSTTLFGV